MKECMKELLDKQQPIDAPNADTHAMSILLATAAI